MSDFIFNDYVYYVNDIFDINKKIKEDKKKILVSNIFKDVFNSIQYFLNRLIKIYFYFDEKIKDLDRLFNFNEDDLKLIDKIYKLDIKKIDKTCYKKYLNITMKFIDNWENFILAIIKDINENNENYIVEKIIFEFYIKKNCRLKAKLLNNQQLYKSYFINFEIYDAIFTFFNHKSDQEIYIKEYYLNYMESFLTNINVLFKFNILPNTDKRIKILFSYFSNKINKKYEYLIEYKKMLKTIDDFYMLKCIRFDISNLDYLNAFVDTTFIFYEFLNLCFVLLEDNIEF